MCSPAVIHSEAGSGGMKGNIVRAMLPFISGHRRNPRVRGTRPRELSAPTAAIEKRCHHHSGALGFLARATTCRWAGSLGIASHAGLEVRRSGRGDWKGGFVSGGVEAQLRAPTFSVVTGRASAGRRLNSLRGAERIGGAPSRVPPWLRFR